FQICTFEGKRRFLSAYLYFKRGIRFFLQYKNSKACRRDVQKGPVFWTLKPCMEAFTAIFLHFQPVEWAVGGENHEEKNHRGHGSRTPFGNFLGRLRST
ncbi:MAG TPA: hypothetical protein VN512_08045, partial [Clostridia bacterium]|nr:hypothetical protein [Clostridia bacterium]